MRVDRMQQHGKLWGFWDETDTELVGTFSTEGEAREELKRYARALDGPDRACPICHHWPLGKGLLVEKGGKLHHPGCILAQ